MKTEAEILELLRDAVEKAGGRKEWARANRCSLREVHDALLGRDLLSAAVARALGYEITRIFNSFDETSSPAVYGVGAIVEALNCHTSYIAALMGVSRQAIYNWQGGEEPSAENLAKLRDLSRAVDVFSAATLKPGSRALSRPLIDGYSFIELVGSGRPAADMARRLVEVLAQEALQRDRLGERLAGRSGVPMLDD